MAKVIILNAPAGCGKDTIAKLLVAEGYEVEEFKSPMFDVAVALSGQTRQEFMLDYNDREAKEAPQARLGGLSYREFMIKISEEWAKPLLGNSVFGSLASNSCNRKRNVVFSDGGFIDEVNYLVSAGHDVTVVRMHRLGFTFEGDSRNYIYPESCRSFDINLIDNFPERAVEEIMMSI